MGVGEKRCLLRNFQIFQVKSEHHLLWEDLSDSTLSPEGVLILLLRLFYFYTVLNIMFIALSPPPDARAGLNLT